MNIEQSIIEQFGKNVYLEPLDKYTYRLYLPVFHEDEDMLSIYISKDTNSSEFIVHDYGNTLLRLSYSFNLDSDHKNEILNNIISSYGAILAEDDIQMKTYHQNIAQTVLQYTHLVAKVSNIEILRRETVKSLFYENLSDFIQTELNEYSPIHMYKPIIKRDDLAADWAINSSHKPFYLFGVKDNRKANDVTICCLEFWKARLPFNSIIIYEDFQSIGRTEQTRLTNVADKQFTSLDDFKSDGAQYIKRFSA